MRSGDALGLSRFARPGGQTPIRNVAEYCDRILALVFGETKVNKVTTKIQQSFPSSADYLHKLLEN
jgi:hypothetical protein